MLGVVFTDFTSLLLRSTSDGQIPRESQMVSVVGRILRGPSMAHALEYKSDL